MAYKRIIFTYNYAANYILHIFAVAKSSYDSEYADRYRSTVQPQDLGFLESHRYLLEFGNGQTGPFTPLCLFLPAYLDLRTKDDFVNYYHSLNNGLENNNFSKFLQRYPIDWGDPFLSASYKALMLELSDEEWGKTIKPLMPKFRKVAQIFINNTDGYKQVWKQAELVLKERAEKWNKHFDKSNIIQEWERITGKTFLKDKYYILLCYANKNGPDANSLSYNKNIFYYSSSDEYIREFVSHEVGTHLLFELFYPSGFDSEFDQVRYAALESLAMFFNLKVLKSEGLSYDLPQFRCGEFLSLYGKHYYKGIKPEELMELTLKEML
jgi:hypothetical protein